MSCYLLEWGCCWYPHVLVILALPTPKRQLPSTGQRARYNSFKNGQELDPFLYDLRESLFRTHNPTTEKIRHRHHRHLYSGECCGLSKGTSTRFLVADRRVPYSGSQDKEHTLLEIRVKKRKPSLLKTI